MPVDDLNIPLSQYRQDDWNRLLKRIYPKVFGVCWRILKDECLAQEAVQTTFCKVYENASGFRGDSALRTWIYRIALNESLMLLRKKRRNREDQFAEIECSGDTVSALVLVSSATPNPEVQYFRSVVGLHIKQCIESLSPIYSEVFILRDIEGRSTPEVVEMLGIGRDTIKTRLSRARLMLQSQLGMSFADLISLLRAPLER